jgi:hypothetical protein
MTWFLLLLLLLLLLLILLLFLLLLLLLLLLIAVCGVMSTGAATDEQPGCLRLVSQVVLSVRSVMMVAMRMVTAAVPHARLSPGGHALRRALSRRVSARCGPPAAPG